MEHTKQKLGMKSIDPFRTLNVHGTRNCSSIEMTKKEKQARKTDTNQFNETVVNEFWETSN